ncbi:hypothetical protein L3X37_05975 [Sabulilitoribacter arenilitoris]|uniref:Uncharacterized protein n=1 Tax=Wocania arenilitoris TaxID=2044858 RepID=A0AAE3EM55_9FLAO|nr:hypothetical protein [Wocania arenilitoris]MCF7567913.1 hypothetical protein [Wocania arenilitoris]
MKYTNLLRAKLLKFNLLLTASFLVLSCSKNSDDIVVVIDNDKAARVVGYLPAYSFF